MLNFVIPRVKASTNGSRFWVNESNLNIKKNLVAVKTIQRMNSYLEMHTQVAKIIKNNKILS